jgi:hypothetical protein
MYLDTTNPNRCVAQLSSPPGFAANSIDYPPNFSYDPFTENVAKFLVKMTYRIAAILVASDVEVS